MFRDRAEPVSPVGGALALAALALLSAGLVWTGRPPEAGVVWRVAFVGVHAASFALLVGWLRARRPGVKLVVLGAVLARVIVLPMGPSLSDDGYRYLWDGRHHEIGVSPYAHRPADAELDALRPSVLYDRMNSEGYYSVYPPASQAVFALAAMSWGSWWGEWLALKGMLVLFEGLGMAALIWWAGPRKAALYAWSPLAVVEIAGQGHTEALVIVGLGLLLVGRATRWPVASAGATIAGLAKLYPFALVPAAWRRDGWTGILASLTLIIGLTAPFAHPDAFEHVRESLGLFFGTFDEYAAPYLALKAAIHPVAGDSAGRLSSGLLGLGFAVVTARALLRDDRTQEGVLRLSFVVIAAFSLTATTLHPWYWLPLLYLSPLTDARWAVWISAASTGGYLTYVIPEVWPVVLAVGWGGAAALAWRDRTGSHGHGATVASTESGVAADASSHTASG